MIEDLPYEVVNGVPMTVWKGFKESKLYLVNTMAEWRAFYELLMKEKLVACDTETTGFDWFDGDKMVGMSFGWRDEHFYIPVRHKESVLGGKTPAQIDMDDIRGDLQAFFAQKDVFTIFHYLKFDAHFYAVDDIEVLTPSHDTVILWHLFDENAPGKLKVIASGWRDIMGRWHKGLISKDANEKEKEVDRWRTAEAKARRKIYSKAVMDMADELQTEPKYQGWNRRDLKKHIQLEFLVGHPYQGAHKEDIHYGYIPVSLMCEYAGMDTYMTWYIYKHVMKHMDWNQDLRDLYINEMQLSKVLRETEVGGTVIDKQCLVALGKSFDQKIEDLDRTIKTKLGKPDINLGSGDQLACALVQNGVMLTKLTDASTEDKPKFCTDKKVLEKVKHQHEAIPLLMELNSIKTLNSMFVRGILGKLVNGNMLHCSFNQNVSTGRMSGREPNLMNIPRSDKSIRRAFVVPDPDYVFVFADYSQVEVRLTAHFSQDVLLLDAYTNNQDIHTRTLCEMFGHDYAYVKNILDTDPSHPQYDLFSELRSTSKCVHPSTIVRTSKGLRRMDQLFSFSETSEMFKKCSNTFIKGENDQAVRVKSAYNGGTKELVHVITNRSTLTCSKNHRFQLENGQLVRAGELSVGDILPVTTFATSSVSKPLVAPVVDYKPFKDVPSVKFYPTEDTAYIAGAFMGDGSVQGEHSVSITHGDWKNQDKLGIPYSVWQEILCKELRRSGFSPIKHKTHIYMGSRSVLRFFTALGLVDPDRELDKNSQKSFRIPAWVLEGGEEFIANFLAGLFDTDGTVTKRDGVLSFTTKSPVLAGHVCEALSSLGLKFTNELSYNKPYDKYYHRVRLMACYSGFFKEYMKHPGKLLRFRKYEPNHKRNHYRVEHRVLQIQEAGKLPCVDVEVLSDSHLYKTNGLITHNTINFGIIYGVGAPGLSNQIERPDEYKDATQEEWQKRCQEFIDIYMHTYLGVKRFINAAKRIIRKDAIVYNTFGRPRRLPDVNVLKITKDEGKKWMKAKAERKGVNFLIQGEAADIFKIAAVRVHKILKGSKSRLVNFVHDEVQIYMHKDDMHLLKPIKKAMEDFPQYSVPLVVDFGYSTTNWADKKELKAA